MMLLPKKIGPFTLVRKLGTGGVSETYAGVLDDAERKKVAVRRVLPYILQDHDDAELYLEAQARILQEQSR